MKSDKLWSSGGVSGDGIIELKKIRAWMEAAGYCGAAEVVC